MSRGGDAVMVRDPCCRRLQIGDLDTEDSKKDTMVDVVFKKALKEFRLNIFNSYSTALTVRNPPLSPPA